MQIQRCQLGESTLKIACSMQAISDAKADAPDVVTLFLAHQGLVKTASRKAVNFAVSPELAEKFDINLHLAQAQSDSEDGPQLKTAKTNESDFVEETISVPSSRKYEPNYLCSVVFQRPDPEIYAVSAYLIETYLGRYAFKSQYYFKESSRRSALRCYERIVTAVKDLRVDFNEKGLSQNEFPYHLKRALQGEVGEIEPKSNKTATYLDPKNQQIQTKIGSENILYIPTHKSIKDDLILPGKG